MGSEALARHARRDIRKAVGEDVLIQFETLAADLQHVKAELTAKNNRLQLLIGRATDDDVKVPILLRLSALIDAEENLARAFLGHIEREMALSARGWRGIYRRATWLLTGR